MMALHRYYPKHLRIVFQLIHSAAVKRAKLVLLSEINYWSSASLPFVTICWFWIPDIQIMLWLVNWFVGLESFHISIFGSLAKKDLQLYRCKQSKPCIFSIYMFAFEIPLKNPKREVPTFANHEKMQSIRWSSDFLSNWISFLLPRCGMWWRKSHSATTEGTRAACWACSGPQWSQIVFIQEQMIFLFTNGTSPSRSTHGLLRVSVFKQKIFPGGDVGAEKWRVTMLKWCKFLCWIPNLPLTLQE